MKAGLKTIFVLTFTSKSALGAVISWDPVVVNTTSNDINTEGVIHTSSNSAGTSDQTINGVTFIAEPDGPVRSNAEGSFYTTGTGVNTTGDISLDALLDSHSYEGFASRIEITGLIDGDSYLVQMIAVGDTRGCCADRNQQYGGQGSISGDLRRGDPSSVVGRFTADGTTQIIDVLIGSGAQSTDPGVSGFQVRNVTVPEPSSLLLIGMSGLSLLFYRRKI